MVIRGVPLASRVVCWSVTVLQLLRHKCEAYSTMNDTDEDTEVERRLNERMLNAGGTAPPHPSLMAPAALYLTAILECVFSRSRRYSLLMMHVS